MSEWTREPYVVPYTSVYGEYAGREYVRSSRSGDQHRRQRVCLLDSRTGEILPFSRPSMLVVLTHHRGSMHGWTRGPTSERLAHLHLGDSVVHLPELEVVSLRGDTYYESWIARDGRHFYVPRMALDHIDNCLAMIERQLIAIEATAETSTDTSHRTNRKALWFKRFDRERRRRLGCPLPGDELPLTWRSS